MLSGVVWCGINGVVCVGMSVLQNLPAGKKTFSMPVFTNLYLSAGVVCPGINGVVCSGIAGVVWRGISREAVFSAVFP